MNSTDSGNNRPQFPDEALLVENGLPTVKGAIDAHCHIEWGKYGYPDFDSCVRVLSRAQELGNMRAVITSSLTPDAVAIKEKFKERMGDFIQDFLFQTIGVAPGEPELEKHAPLMLQILKSQIESGDVSAVGEVGLDYHWIKDEDGRSRQEAIFRDFIEVAMSTDSPIVIHSRDAEEKCFSILDEYHSRKGLNVLFHSFSGPIGLIKEIVDRNWLISIPTSILYRKKTVKIGKRAPIENLVVETDAPWLHPYPGELGDLNEPLLVLFAIKRLARAREESVEEVSRVTAMNAMKFYNIEG